MQDVAQAPQPGDVISKVGFAPAVYQKKDYIAPPTATANPPTSTVIPPEVRFAVIRGGRAGGRGPAAPAVDVPPGGIASDFATATPAAGGPRGGGAPAGNDYATLMAAAIRGAAVWPINPEKNRPSFSPDWVQAPRPSAKEWYPATVPGTVLTTLVNNNIYPDPLYGENNRPNIIPETLSQTSYWYRNEFAVPAAFAGRQVWLNFAGINYFAEVWVNGTKVGGIKGAFVRGNFNVTPYVTPGQKAAVAVLILPPPHPGFPWEKTVANQRGPNGGGDTGPLGLDGPTFVASIGWDWVPGIRDRQIGLWQEVTLSASGPVLVQNPFVVTDLPLPSTATAEVSIEATLQNISDAPQTGVFTGKFGNIAFQSAAITLPPHASQVVKLNPTTTPALHLTQPKLWWPNGFGDPYLYPLHLAFELNGAPSDTQDLKIGVREVTYFVEGSDNLTLSVNGVRVFAKGGNWGMDEALKRLPHDRLEAQIKLHQRANYTIIRNWVGQSTSEDFFALCDQYGIMVWDEFFQANPANGLNPLDPNLYLANVRDTVLRYRNHPSIVVWCGRNEGAPPPDIDAGNGRIIQELDQTRYYQASSTAGHGVRSGGGGYGWRTPETFYNGTFAFNTEVGSSSIPNLESIQAWMPEKDWFDQNFPNDDWAEHDLTTGAGNPANNPLQNIIAARYGPFHGLPEFVRKAQMADYEAYRAMYENRLFRLFTPSTAIITWMSNPAQPCLVWQIYDYSLEPFASYFAVQKACEPVHIMMTQDAAYAAGVVNNTARPLEGLKYRVQIFNLDGTRKYDATNPVPAVPASTAANLGAVPVPEGVSPVHFVKLQLLDAQNKIVSDNFYWRETVLDDLKALDSLPDVQLDSAIRRHDAAGNVLLDVTLTNPGPVAAVMAHVQLRNQRTNARVLPVYYTENYISLLPGESKTITLEAAAKDLGTDQPLVVVDGWNVTSRAQTFTTGGPSSIATNANAYVKRRPPPVPVAMK